MDIKKELFNIFQQEKDTYRLYEKVVKFAEELANDTKGKENAEFYDVLIHLENSINNAGWEKRHSEQISYIWTIKNGIVGRYEDYLF